MVLEAPSSAALPWRRSERGREMKATRGGEAGSIRSRPPPRRLKKIGLSLPGRCLFVSPRLGLKRQRMQAAREERQRTGRGGGRKREPSQGLDHLRRLLCSEIMRAHKAGAGRRAGAPGERGVRRVSSVESRAGVCARGLPHTVPASRNNPPSTPPPELPPIGSSLSRCTSFLPSSSSLSICHTVSDVAVACSH